MDLYIDSIEEEHEPLNIISAELNEKSSSPPKSKDSAGYYIFLD